MKNERKRLELKGSKGNYLIQLRSLDGPLNGEGGWEGLTSEEGWKAWLGPISVAQQKVIVSQESGAKLAQKKAR